MKLKETTGYYVFTHFCDISLEVCSILKKNRPTQKVFNKSNSFSPKTLII